MNGDPTWQRQVNGPATHAFVIGVSDYPDAKPGRGHEAKLRNVPDIASADAGAMLMADWLFEHQDDLVAPLASLDVLHGSAAVPAGRSQYAWRHLPAPAHVLAPTRANVIAAGQAWLTRLQQGAGNVAFFFICGHGASKSGHHVVFLSDLNSDPFDPWGAHIDMSRLANAFRQQPSIGAGLFYADACQEFLPVFELADSSTGVRFFPPNSPFLSNSDKVSLVSAASHNMLAYEGEWSDDPSVRIGRFTETLVDALGTSVREDNQRWLVHSGSIQEDLKHLHRARRPEWNTLPFEPTFGMTPNERLPIAHVADPVVPIVVITDPPDRMASCALSIHLRPDQLDEPIDSRPAGNANQWVPRLKASAQNHLLAARLGAKLHTATFTPRSPLFDQKVPVS